MSESESVRLVQAASLEIRASVIETTPEGVPAAHRVISLSRGGGRAGAQVPDRRRLRRA